MRQAGVILPRMKVQFNYELVENEQQLTSKKFSIKELFAKWQCDSEKSANKALDASISSQLCNRRCLFILWIAFMEKINLEILKSFWRLNFMTVGIVPNLPQQCYEKFFCFR